VGDRPPNVTECGEARDRIAKVEVVDLVGHGLVTPGIVGMEEDAVSLDARGLKLEEALLETLEVLGVEAGVVVGFAGGVGCAAGGKWQHLFALTEWLGQNAGAGLVELAGHAGERVRGVVVAGEEEGVGGGAGGKVRCAVGVPEVELVRGGDGAVVAGPGRRAGEAAGVTVELGGRADGFVGPGAGGVGHETDAPGTVAVVEAFDVDGAVLLRELRGEGDVVEGIAGGGAPEGELVEAPLLNVTGFGG